MTIGVVPGCVYPDGVFTVGQPLGGKSPVAWGCEAVLTNCYLECRLPFFSFSFLFFSFSFLFDIEPSN